MGTTMCVPRRRRDDSPLSYFGISVSTLTVYEQRLVQQSTSYIPGVPILLQDIAFYWDSQVGGAAAGGTTAAVSPDSIWIASVEKTINEFAKKCKLFSLKKNARVGKGSSDAKKRSSGKNASRVFEKPFNAFLGKTPLHAPHFVALLTLFLRKLPDPLLTSLYVRQAEDILSNKNLSEEEKAQALQKSSRQTFMSTHPTEHAVYQYLKQLVQRHRAELITAEVELLVRSMVREPNENVMEFILQQLRPVVGPVLTKSKRETPTESKPQLHFPHEPTSGVLGDGAIITEEEVYSPPGSHHSEAAEEERVSMGGTPTDSSQPSSARRTSCGETENTSGKKKNALGGKPPAEGENGLGSAMSCADATDSSQSSVAAEENSAGEAQSEGHPVASKAVKIDSTEEVDSSSSSSVRRVLVPKERLQATSSEEEKQEEGNSTTSKNVENPPHREASLADSLQTMSTSGVVLTNARRKRHSTPEKRKKVPMDAKSVNIAGGGDNDTEKKGVGDVFSDPRGDLNLDAQIAKRRKAPSLCTSSETSHPPHDLSGGAVSPVNEEDVETKYERQEKQQRSPLHRVLPSCLEKKPSQTQLLDSSVAVESRGRLEDSNPTIFSGKGALNDAPRSFVEKHPCFAALLGAKQLFLGKENLPPKQIEPGRRLSGFIMESVDAETKGGDPESLSMRQVLACTAEGINVVDRRKLVHYECNDFFSEEGTDKFLCVHVERVLQKVIYPLIVQIEQLTTKSESIERLLRTNGIVSPPCQAPKLVKQLEDEITVLKDVVRQVVETHSGAMEDILNLQQQIEEQRSRVECDAVGIQKWQSDALSAKEMALEAQRRCANLEKAQLQSHQSCQYMSLKLRDLASEIERGEKESLGLKIEVSTLQRQAVLLREGLLSIH
ncbi:C-terminal motor kinesin, putative [Trypanosoma cruzi marinkellei]|uniref:C-terminal motor kinesin, putative n=1 Tax=Trypanosoma cruzi marinkellei TaxID=85056 RepID=K2M4C6_TRYCR|nr:C-terminal motor kinesin, putative [Trypanosoma cruzi marinkellei]